MYRQEHPPGLEYVHMQKHWEAMSDEALAAAALQAEDRAFTVLVARLLPPCGPWPKATACRDWTGMTSSRRAF